MLNFIAQNPTVANPDAIGGLILLLFLVIGGLWLYFLPGLIASHRKTRYTAGITLLNLFLGWTLLGWVGALIWAVSAQPNTAAQTTAAPTPQRPA